MGARRGSSAVLLIIGLLMVIFGGGWHVGGLPMRSVGVVILILGLGEPYLWRLLFLSSARREHQSSETEEHQSPQTVESASHSGIWVPEHGTGSSRQGPAKQETFHIALRPDGAGATFSLERETSEPGRHRWTWSYDAVLAGKSLDFAYRVNQATYVMDRVMGLPVDEVFLRPPVLVGYGDEQIPDSLPGWPWDEFRSRPPRG
jgi:hypothetical protein